VISTFHASDQIQKFKVTFCDLEGFGASRIPFMDWSAENSRNWNKSEVKIKKEEMGPIKKGAKANKKKT